MADEGFGKEIVEKVRVCYECWWVCGIFWAGLSNRARSSGGVAVNIERNELLRDSQSSKHSIHFTNPKQGNT